MKQITETYFDRFYGYEVEFVAYEDEIEILSVKYRDGTQVSYQDLGFASEADFIESVTEDVVAELEEYKGD